MRAPLDALTVLTTKGPPAGAQRRGAPRVGAPPAPHRVRPTRGPPARRGILAVGGGGPPTIENYGKAQRFSFDEWEVSNFPELARALKPLHDHRPNSFV